VQNTRNTGLPFRRPNAGPLRLVVADLAGTVLDYGSCAPAGAFVRVFDRHGVRVTETQARGPMGLDKKEHLRALMRLPSVAEAWEEATGRRPAAGDVETLYVEFEPLQQAAAAGTSDLIPGVTETVGLLRERGIAVAVTTGYSQPIASVVLAEARRQGFVPDAAFCAGDVPQGRPAPWMAFRCMMELGVYPAHAAVKVGDTEIDIEAGRNAGMWTVGVTKTGNMLGLGLEAAQSLSSEELSQRLGEAERRLTGAGAHYVVESFAEMPGVVDDINRRFPRGERP
jgi:phosphonoacetaldehyde hydrolase